MRLFWTGSGRGNHEIETVWFDPIGSRAREWGLHAAERRGGVVVGWQKRKIESSDQRVIVIRREGSF
jgi:hypothetical protein